MKLIELYIYSLQHSMNFFRPIPLTSVPGGVTPGKCGYTRSYRNIQNPPLSMEIFPDFTSLFVGKHWDFGSWKTPLFSQSMERRVYRQSTAIQKFQQCILYHLKWGVYSLQSQKSGVCSLLSEKRKSILYHFVKVHTSTLAEKYPLFTESMESMLENTPFFLKSMDHAWSH